LLAHASQIQENLSQRTSNTQKFEDSKPLKKVTFDLERNSETIIEIDKSQHHFEEESTPPTSEIDIEQKIKEI